MRFDFTKFAAAVTAISIALLTVLGFQDQLYDAISSVGFDKQTAKPHVDHLVYVLIVVVIISLPVAHFLKILSKLPVSVVLERLRSSVTTEQCNEKDLADIAVLAYTTFGGRASGIETIKKIYKYAPNTYWKVANGNKIEGYIVIYGLTSAGEAAIAESSFSGAHPVFKYIRKDIKHAKAICISAVVGTNVRSRAAIINSIAMLIQIYKFERVYAKAVTKDGLRLIIKNGFCRVDGNTKHELDYYYTKKV